MLTSRKLLALTFTLALSACGSGQDTSPAKTAATPAPSQPATATAPAKEDAVPADLGQAMRAVAEAMNPANEMGKEPAVEPVDFRALKALLPETLAGLKRSEASGERNSVMGISVATAQARYASDDRSIDLDILDYGNLSGFAAMAAVGWMMTELDRESDTGYEKVYVTDGRKVHESYDKPSKSGEINTVVANRFIVNLQGNGVDMAQIKQALAQIDFAKLESLGKGAGKPAGN